MLFNIPSYVYHKDPDNKLPLVMLAGKTIPNQKLAGGEYLTLINEFKDYITTSDTTYRFLVTCTGSYFISDIVSHCVDGGHVGIASADEYAYIIKRLGVVGKYKNILYKTKIEGKTITFFNLSPLYSKEGRQKQPELHDMFFGINRPVFKLPAKHNIITIQNKQQVADAIKVLSKSDGVAFDVETYGLTPETPKEAKLKHKLYCCCFSDGVNTYYTEGEHLIDITRWFLYEYTGEKIAHNIPFDLYWLYWTVKGQFSIETSKVRCTMYTETFLNPIASTKLKPQMVYRYLDADFKYAVDIENINSMSKDVVVNYCALDAMYTYWIWQIQKKKISKAKLFGKKHNEHLVCNHLMPTLLCTTLFKGVSLPVDIVEFENLFKVFSDKYKKADDEVKQILQGKTVIDYLFSVDGCNYSPLKRTGTGLPSTTREDLEALALVHTDDKLLPALIKKSRVANLYNLMKHADNKATTTKPKEAGDYRRSMYYDADTDSYSYKPIMRLFSARTGRTSCASPNLQAVSKRTKGKVFRKCIVPLKDHYLLATDYSQIEPRMLAWLADDKVLISDFVNDRDIYSQIGKSLNYSEEASLKKRDTLKLVFLALLYEASVPTIAVHASISPLEATTVVNAIKTRYRASFKFIAKLKNRYAQDIPIVTPFGRKLKKGLNTLQIANTVIQSTASDVCMTSARELYYKGYKVGLTIHDENMLQVHKSVPLNKIVPDVQNIMQHSPFYDHNMVYKPKTDSIILKTVSTYHENNWFEGKVVSIKADGSTIFN